MNEDWTGRDRDDEPLAEAVGRLRAARVVVPDVSPRVLHAVDAEIDAAAERGAGTGVAADIVARLDRATPRAGAVVVDTPTADGDAGRAGSGPQGATGDVPALADGLRDRLAHRREATAAARHAAAAYAAVHGHVPGGSEEELQAATRRWALRPRTAVVATCAVLVLAIGLALTVSRTSGQVDDVALAEVPEASAESQPDPLPGSAPTPAATEPGTSDPATAGAASASVVVDVVGQVHHPGLVTLPEGSRVADAVAAAGGATDGAEVSAINLARPVIDGEQIRVPAPGEVVTPPTAPADGAAPQAPPGGSGVGGLVNLNTADEATLDTLPGIGPALAARIVAWRTDNGPFASVDELDDVSGIGPAMLAKVRDLVTV